MGIDKCTHCPNNITVLTKLTSVFVDPLDHLNHTHLTHLEVCSNEVVRAVTKKQSDARAPGHQ